MIGVMEYRQWSARLTAGLLVASVCQMGWSRSDVKEGEGGDGASRADVLLPGPTIYQLTIRSLNVSPDGRFVVFGTRKLAPGVEAGEMRIRDLMSGESQEIDSKELSKFESPQPVWSPDGRYLAFYGLPSGGKQLVVWDRERARTIRRSEQVTCSLDTCEFWQPVWTPDGQYVLFIADRSPKGRNAKGTELLEDVTHGLRTLDDVLLGITPAPEGVTVLKSPALLAEDSGSAAVTADGRQRFPPTEIVALDVKDGSTRRVAAGAPFVGLQVSADGRLALAVVQERERVEDRGRVYSLYALPLALEEGSTDSREAKSVAAGTPVDSQGSPLRQLATRVPNWQAGRSVSLAPSGRFVSYTTTGPAATGDVYVVEVASGDVRNLTAGASVPVNPLDAKSDTVPEKRRGDWHGRFGAEHTAPIWTADEQAVLVVRPVISSKARPLGGFPPMRFELWRVELENGAAARVPTPENLSIEGLAVCADRQLPCLVGEAKEVVAKVRFLEDDTAAIAAIDPDVGAVRILRRIGRAGVNLHANEHERSTSRRDMSAAASVGMVVGVEETHEHPPELWWADLARKTSERLDVLNPGPVPPHGKLERVEWTSPDGEVLGALLRLPADAVDGERLPVVMVVYGSAYLSHDDGRFDGGSDWWFNTLRTRGRYAVLTPDLPASKTRNGGQNCDGMAANAVAALDAAEKTGLVDSRRAGVIGHSWGGYTVSCLITRTNRFRAAVSVAGISNLLSVGMFGGGRGGLGALANIDVWPWENPQVYVNETPGFHLENVATPLLIVYGKRDRIALNHHKEMYDGLSALNKPVVLVGYDNSGHGEMLQYSDFWERVLQWFGTYL